MSKILLVAFLITTQALSAYAAGRSSHTLSGIIYFTNNSPDYETFPVELYTRDQKRRLISSRAHADGTFTLAGVKHGRYLLKITWPPNRCTLWYRVSVPKDANKRIRVIMDAACSGHDGKIQDLDEN